MQLTFSLCLQPLNYDVYCVHYIKVHCNLIVQVCMDVVKLGITDNYIV